MNLLQLTALAVLGIYLAARFIPWRSLWRTKAPDPLKMNLGTIASMIETDEQWDAWRVLVDAAREQ